MLNNIITVSGVSKFYAGASGRVPALVDVSFDVPQGCIFGLIGPDGAGKTTTFRIIATLMLPDCGEVTVSGLSAKRDYREIRRFIGYMPGRFSLYQDLSVQENLEFFARIFGVKIGDNLGLIEGIYSQLEPFKNRLAGRLSGGMKQKLALCCALIHCPRLLLLDEPTTGVDPVSRQELWEILGAMRSKGISVLVSTPYMDEAMNCDKMAFISKGKILKTGSPQNIIDSFPQQVYRVRGPDAFRLLKFLRGLPCVRSAYSFGDSCHVCVKSTSDIGDVKRLLARDVGPGIKVEEFSASLEDCFIRLAQSDDN